ncbi:MAG: hypothetical protein ACI9JN_001074 [Bacteroidia bacterium]|jgi:hypothetical protein
MKRTTLTLIGVLIVLSTQAQSNYKSGILNLSSIYKNYMFMSAPSKALVKETQTNNTSDSLRITTRFVLESLKPKSKILKPEFITLPNDHVLKSVYLVRQLSQNLRKESSTNNDALFDSLYNTTIDRKMLVKDYYSVAFTANGNKNKPFNLSKYNFDLNTLNLNTDIEKGIFFLTCMDACGSQIWGLMNIPKPPNTGKASSLINKFPEINGTAYYKYTDLYFKDFMVVYDDSIQSYKTIYVHKYYDLLLNHLICFNKENKGQKEIQELLLSSVLKDHKLYKYTTHRKTLEKIFKKQ